MSGPGLLLSCKECDFLSGGMHLLLLPISMSIFLLPWLLGPGRGVTWRLAEDSTLPPLNKLDELGAYIVDRLDQEAEAISFHYRIPLDQSAASISVVLVGPGSGECLLPGCQKAPLTFHFLPVLGAILRLRHCTNSLNINNSLPYSL